MGIIYIFSLILLITSFMLFKKSDNKISFIKWLIISFAGIYAYNITICMILGILHIPAYIIILSIINILFSIILLIKPIKNKEIQKYSVNKFEVISIFILIILFTIMFVKDLYIYNGNISHMAIDSAIHYRAAKHYSENLKLFVFDDDKTFFNFNVMQTGAYINDGIFMNVINSITGIDQTFLYQAFETITLFMNVLVLYAFIIDKIKTKRGIVASGILLALFAYGYPYNSWIYGFSYLSVGMMMVTNMLLVVSELFGKDNIKKYIILILITITGMGIIFSYSLFVPAIFASVCIYVFVKELLDKDSKKYLKIFGKYTLIVTGSLLLVTIFGFLYLFLPTFFIEDQTNLVSALKIDGAIYSEKYKNFLVYIPFLIIFVIDTIIRFKNKEIRYLDIFSIIVMLYLVVFYGGMLLKVVSPYYMLKIYFIVWTAIFAITLDIANEYIDKKIFKLDAILLVLFYIVLIFGKISIESGIRIGLIIALTFFTVLPEILKDKIKFNKIRISSTVYICVWGVFVALWVLLKAGPVLSEEQKHSLPNLVGIYYSENCEYRKLIDVTQNFNKNDNEITKYIRENISDFNVENTEIITGNYYYTRVWTVATLEIDSITGIAYENIIQDVSNHTIEEGLNNNAIRYIIEVMPNEEMYLNSVKENLDSLKNLEDDNIDVTILYENSNGFIARIDR